MQLSNKILCGDALEVLREMPSGYFDLVVTSPPYNMGYTFNQDHDRHKILRQGYSDIFKDDMDEEEYSKYHCAVLSELWRVIKEETGAIFYNRKFRIIGKRLYEPVLSIGDDGFACVRGTDIPIREIIIWNVGHRVDFNRCYFPPGYQNIYLIAKERFRITKEALFSTSVWDLGSQASARKGSAVANDHPVPFPVALPWKALTSCEFPDKTVRVLDPFMGSGTTAIACKSFGAEYTGIEINPDFVGLAEKRITNSGFSFGT